MPSGCCLDSHRAGASGRNLFEVSSWCCMMIHLGPRVVFVCLLPLRHKLHARAHSCGAVASYVKLQVAMNFRLVPCWTIFPLLS